MCNFLVGPPRGSLPAYAVKTALASGLGSAALVFVAFAVGDMFGIAPSEEEGPQHAITWLQLFGLVVFAPLVETMLLAGLVTGLAALIRSWLIVAVLSALIWGGLHALLHPFWFFGTVWSFFLYSCGYLRWREHSHGRAFVAAALPHALVNAAVFGLLALPGGSQ